MNELDQITSAGRRLCWQRIGHLSDKPIEDFYPRIKTTSQTLPRRDECSRTEARWVLMQFPRAAAASSEQKHLRTRAGKHCQTQHPLDVDTQQTLTVNLMLLTVMCSRTHLCLVLTLVYNEVTHYVLWYSDTLWALVEAANLSTGQKPFKAIQQATSVSTPHNGTVKCDVKKIWQSNKLRKFVLDGSYSRKR